MGMKEAVIIWVRKEAVVLLWRVLIAVGSKSPNWSILPVQSSRNNIIFHGYQNDFNDNEWKFEWFSDGMRMGFE